MSYLSPFLSLCPSLPFTLLYISSCFLVCPFSSTRSRQATRHLQQYLQTHYLWNRRLVFDQRCGNCIWECSTLCTYSDISVGDITAHKLCELAAQDYNSSSFSGSATLYWGSKASLTWISIKKKYCKKTCPKGIIIYDNVSKSVLLFDSLWSSAILGPTHQ